MTASDSRLANDINEQFLVCKICYDVLRTPKTLECLHTFCADCLDKHLDAESDRQSYRFTAYSRALSCPICRKKTEMPAGGVRRLPDNFLVASLAEIIGRKHLLGSKGCDEGPACEICQPANNYTGKLAVARCLDCAKLLCRRCVDLHRRTKVTHAHSVIDMDVLNKDIACKQHVDEAVRYYCETCEMCICVVCTFQEHKAHEVFSFSDSLDRCTRTLQPLVSKCREHVDEARRQLNVIERCEKDIKTVEEQIRDSIMESMADIRRQERQLIENIAYVYGEEGAKFIGKKDSLHEIIEGLLDAQAVADMLVREQSVELLFVRRDVEEKLKVLLQRHLGQVPELINRPIKFVPKSLQIGYLSGSDNDQPDIFCHSLGSVQPTVSEAVQTNELSTNDRITMTALSLLNNATVETQTGKGGYVHTSSKRGDNSISTSSACSSESEEEDSEELIPTLDNPKVSSLTNNRVLNAENVASFNKYFCMLKETIEASSNVKGSFNGKHYENNKENDMSLVKIVTDNGDVVGCLYVSKEYLMDKYHVSSTSIVKLDDLPISNAPSATNGLSLERPSQRITKHCDRSSSPVAELLGNYSVVVNDGQRAVHISLSNSSAVHKVVSKDANVGTEATVASDKSCSPIRLLHPSVGVMASCAMAHKCSQSIVDTADAETEVRAATTERGTAMHQVTLVNRETTMPAVHVMHKNLGTDSQEMCDKQTSTVDVTAGYKDAVAKRGLVFVNRGTNTSFVSIRHRETSPPPVGWTCVDRASSPIKLVTMVDKGILAKKGEILEPVDVFYSPGGKMPQKAVDGIRRSATNSPRSPKPPMLESIQEDSSVEHHQQQLLTQSSAPEVSPVRPPTLRHTRNSLPFVGGQFFSHSFHGALNRSPRRISDPLGKSYELDGSDNSQDRRLLFEERVFFPPSFTFDQTKSKDQQQAAASSTLPNTRQDDESQTSFNLQPLPASSLPSSAVKESVDALDGLLPAEESKIAAGTEKTLATLTNGNHASNKVDIAISASASQILTRPNVSSSAERVGAKCEDANKPNLSFSKHPGVTQNNTNDQMQPLVHQISAAADDKTKQEPTERPETIGEPSLTPVADTQVLSSQQEQQLSTQMEKDALSPPSKSSSDRHRKLSPFRKGRRSPATSPAAAGRNKNGMVSGGLASLQRIFSAATHGSGNDSSNGNAKSEEQKGGGILKKFYR